ncbi:SDR family oxidoreductase [Spirillospora sp. NPDC029432]|uniref:SDR family oxidoreductase n=1 Tax=Spirillospora sp. NPDC029432 TaxID=3154599 RepID=UPI0034555CE8
MRVLVTGASGWIGSAVVPELLGAGHDVVGLARSESSAAVLTAAGAGVLRGTLDDLDVLRDAAAASDAVLHLAYKHDVAFAGGPADAAAADRRAIETFGGALAGTGRPLVIASGTLGVAPGRPVTERDGWDPAPASGPRLAAAQLALSFEPRGVRPVVVRLPPTVHGEGDPGFITVLVGIAREKGVSGYIGDGAQRWPAVHRDDAARLFRSALEDAPAGAVLHAVADEGVPIRDIAEVIGRGLGVPAVPVAQPDAGGHFGWLAPMLAVDGPASSALTRELLGWRPSGPGLLDDLGKGHYFQAPPA